MAYWAGMILCENIRRLTKKALKIATVTIKPEAVATWSFLAGMILLLLFVPEGPVFYFAHQ